MATGVETETRMVRVSQLPAGARPERDVRGLVSVAWKYFPAFALVSLLFVWPLVSVFVMSFDGDGAFGNYATFFQSSGYRSALANTFEISVGVTLACVFLGFPYAWSMVAAPKGLSTVLVAMLMIPLWTSMLVRTYAWLLLLNPNGIINSLLLNTGIIDVPLELVHNRVGVLIGMTQIMLPFFVLPLYAVMRGFDMGLLRAAKSLGASPARAFGTVFIPGVAPGLIAGSLLVFVISIGFFVTPALLGGAKDTMLSQLIQKEFSVTLNWGLGSTMATILLVATLILLVIAGLILRPKGRKK